MRLFLNDKNEITGYELSGNSNGAEFEFSKLSDDFEEKFQASFYLLKNNEIVLNPNYVEPTPPNPKTGPNTEQLMINQLGLQVATLTAEVNQLKGGEPNV